MRKVAQQITHSKTYAKRQDRTDRAWLSRLLWHPARKWSGSILSTPEPARGQAAANKYAN